MLRRDGIRLTSCLYVGDFAFHTTLMLLLILICIFVAFYCVNVLIPRNLLVLIMVSGCWIVAHATRLEKAVSCSAQDDREPSDGLVSDHCVSHGERPNHSESNRTRVRADACAFWSCCDFGSLLEGNLGISWLSCRNFWSHHRR